MKLRREQIVLVGSLALLAWMARGFAGSSSPIRGKRKGESPELVAYPAPPVATAVSDEPLKARRAGLERSLFAPPSDTRPLPPLEFEKPPAVALLALLPPPVPGPAPAVFGRFLRTEVPSYDAPDLFGDAEELEDDVAFESAFDEPSFDGEDDAGGAGTVAPPKLTSLERAERTPGWKAVYDWINDGGVLKFGQIQNSDRFNLFADERPIEFVQFNEVDGTRRFPMIAYERSRIEEFGFADTTANRMELKRRELGSALTAGRYDDAVLFAFDCIDKRLESPRALVIAEEVFRLADAIANEDPLPRIGIAECFEAGFKFEAAFDQYRALLDAGYARDPRVLVPLAELEARFRMFASAERRLREAERYGRTTWFVQAGLGRFLLARGSLAEAVEHLRLANQYEPSRVELKAERADMRYDLGAALVALGELDEADGWMTKALQADPGHAQAHAGRIAIRVLRRDAAPANAVSNGAPGRSAEAASEAPSGFEVQLATGLSNLLGEELDAAKRDLLLAAQEDPLRAGKAWRALSWLAEVTGHPEDALRYIVLANENDPTDPWTLYQYGRVLAQRDDLEDALEAFRRALDQELDFPDALAAMGEIEFRRGHHEPAERYFERALQVDPRLVRVHDLRGVNLLELDRVSEAQAAFQAALAIDDDMPSAFAGAAWCSYREGDAEEAIVRLRELDDNRRDRPADDPYRVFAQAQIERLTDHLEKVSWTDPFERRSLRNNWTVEEAVGPTVALVDGRVHLTGVFKERGRSRLWQVKPAGDFVAFEARLTVRGTNSARAGIFVSRETSRRGDTRVESEVTLSRHPLEGAPQVRLVLRAGDEADAPYITAAGFEWPVGEPVTLRIERTGESGSGALRILLDGFAIVDGERLPTLGSTTTELNIGAFVEGDAGRSADVVVDDVEIVYRERR